MQRDSICLLRNFREWKSYWRFSARPIAFLSVRTAVISQSGVCRGTGYERPRSLFSTSCTADPTDPPQDERRCRPRLVESRLELAAVSVNVHQQLESHSRRRYKLLGSVYRQVLCSCIGPSRLPPVQVHRDSSASPAPPRISHSPCRNCNHIISH